ncbi:FimB/Mfa2 family fimbrial subunit [Parapedobacter defluvii]|nr:FimB/Mfa2 family fimbrial subunit [Parapedobacter defluvii]
MKSIIRDRRLFMKATRNSRLYSCMLVLILTSCIKEDLEICLPQPVVIAFSFISSQKCAEDPIIPTDLNRLTVFLFDHNGRFMQQVDTIPTGSSYQVELSLVPAYYQFVAVAGFDNDQLRGAPFVPGVTNIRDAAVSSYLEQRNGSLLSAERVLYLGNDTLTVQPETQGQELSVTLVQQTKTLNVTVDGIANTHYQVALAGNAAQYTFEMEQIYLTGNPLIYIPLQEQDGLFEGKTLINWPLKEEGDYTRLQIIDPTTGRRLVDEIFLELLERVPGIDLACSTGFDIEIVYRINVGLTIYIENWKVYSDGYILI